MKIFCKDRTFFHFRSYNIIRKKDYVKLSNSYSHKKEYVLQFSYNYIRKTKKISKEIGRNKMLSSTLYVASATAVQLRKGFDFVLMHDVDQLVSFCLDLFETSFTSEDAEKWQASVQCDSFDDDDWFAFDQHHDEAFQITMTILSFAKQI